MPPFAGFTSRHNWCSYLVWKGSQSCILGLLSTRCREMLDSRLPDLPGCVWQDIGLDLMISCAKHIGIAGMLLSAAVAAPPSAEYRRPVQVVRETPGLVAFWDFMKREGGRFAAYQAKGDRHDFRLDAANYIKDFWSTGRAATYEDFPLLGRGPFGQAVRFRAERDPDVRPLLMVPRERLHDSGLDVKGPGRSVSMVVWLIRESGNHAVAGIWHEGTDLPNPASAVRRVERGKRQYALFAGLAGNAGAFAAHVSENGAS